MKKRENILEFILKYNFVFSIIVTIILMVLFKNNMIEFFNHHKMEILSVLISLSGTLFGFILTFLSIFIVFKTDEKYKRTEENRENVLISLISNENFNDIYELFIKSSYSFGILLIVSIVYYFTSYGLAYNINICFITIIMFLIIQSMIRMSLSIFIFNTLIRILINAKIKE